jgi:hypothetical protein
MTSRYYKRHKDIRLGRAEQTTVPKKNVNKHSVKTETEMAFIQ